MNDMRELIIGFADVERFLVKSYKCITGGREFDIERYGPYVDAVRQILVPSLEKQILFCLERFVYNEHLQQSSCDPNSSRFYNNNNNNNNNIGASIRAIRKLLTIENAVDFLENSLLTNSRLRKLVDQFDDGFGTKKNFLGYANVINYINEKDFWIRSSRSSSPSSPSIDTSRQYSLMSKDDQLGDLDVLKGSSCLEDRARARGYKRARKRAATDINRKHYKLERLGRLSQGSFRASESLYDLLKSCSCSWALSDSMETKHRKVDKNCDESRRSRLAMAHHRRGKFRKTLSGLKNVNLMLLMRKRIKLGNGTQTEGEKGNRMRCSCSRLVRTFLRLPCRVEQLISKLKTAEFCLEKSRRLNLIERKFEGKLYVVCSCLNDVVKKIDEKMIDSIYLSCDIRDGYLNFKLRRKVPCSRNNSSFFNARISTREAMYRCGLSLRRKRRSQPGRESVNRFFFGRERKIEPRKTEEVSNSGNVDFGEDEEFFSSIEIDRSEGMTIRNSSSISDLVQRLELSPFGLKETEESFRIRSKIRDLIRSIIICTHEHKSAKENETRSISIQAIISEVSSASKIVSKIEDQEEKIFLSDTKLACNKNLGGVDESDDPSGSVRHQKSVVKCRELVTSSSEESGELCTEKNDNHDDNKICDTSMGAFLTSKVIDESGRPSLVSNNILRSLTSEISEALAANSMKNYEDHCEIDVTVEIEDQEEEEEEESSQSSEVDDESGSISRHTHILPSMKSVRLGTSAKHCLKAPEKQITFSSSSSSKSSSPSPSLSKSKSKSKPRNKIVTLKEDRYTTMYKSMRVSSERGTISSKSYERIKRLIGEKVVKKSSERETQEETETETETDRICRGKSGKTIISGGGKYYLTIPSSKERINRVNLGREISESSSSSSVSGGSGLPIRKLDPRISDDDEDEEPIITSNVASFSCNCTEVGSSRASSEAVNFDKNSSYGCIEDRLANRYLADIIDDYCSEEAEEFFESKNVESPSEISTERLSEDFDEPSVISVEENEYWKSFGEFFCMSSEETADRLSIISSVIENSSENYSDEKLGETSEGNFVDPRWKIDYLDKLNGIGWIPRGTEKWSTCGIGSSNSTIDSLVKFNNRGKNDSLLKFRDRGDADASVAENRVGSIGFVVERYKKRFQKIDRNIRRKLLRYVDLCKTIKNYFSEENYF